MNFKRTWFWFFLAAGLFAFIFFFQRHRPAPAVSSNRILPELKRPAVTALQLTVRGQPADLRVERTNDSWQLTKPLAYPAQSANVDMLLSILEQLTPARQFSESELTNHFDVDKNYGFADPQATILLEQPGAGFGPIRIGTNTPPGDQVFLKVVGRDDIYVVDASILKFIPHAPNEWRDTSFTRLRALGFDTFTVTSGNNRLVFQSDPASHLWTMTSPFAGRADNEKLSSFFQTLEHARIQQFVSDQTNVDLEPFGLQTPEHQLVFARGTNVLSRLQFGKSPTNEPARVYACRSGRNGIVTLPKEVLLPWSASMQLDDYRDPYLLHLSEPVAAIEVHAAAESFSLQRQLSNSWRVLPQDSQAFPADSGLINELLGQLNRLKVVEFTAANVVETKLADYGLAPEPLQEFILKPAAGADPAGATNKPLADISFGLDTNRNNLVFARRADESSVYAVPLVEFLRLRKSAANMRERRVFHFSINDVAGATLTQEGRTLKLTRNGPHSWSIAAGNGIIKDLAVEETVDGLCEMSATQWLGRGEQARSQFGLSSCDLKITLELKNGDKPVIELSKPFLDNTKTQHALAVVALEGEPWVFEFPSNLISDVEEYLRVP